MQTIPLIFKLLTIFTAFGGVLLTMRIAHKKKAAEPMVCPLGADCNAVLKSRFSRFFGLPLEYVGMGYYALIAIVYAVLIVLGNAVPEVVNFIVLGLTIGSVLFSIYLIAIQAFVLKNWCTWCLISAVLSALILVFSLVAAEIDIVGFLAQYKTYIVILHAVSAAIGVGAASVTDVFFFKFLKDYRISHSENEVLHTMSQIIWFALGALVLTGIGLYLPATEVLHTTPKFLVKVILVAILILNGVLLNLRISPQLTHISFGEKHKHQPGELHRLRKLAYASGAISITTWYTVFILGSIRQGPLEFLHILGIYLALVTIAIIGSQILDYRNTHRVGEE